METVKAVTLPRHVGKYIRYFLAESEVHSRRTWIAQIIQVVPDEHLLVLKKLSGAGDDGHCDKFFRFYKRTDSVEIYNEDEAILLAFVD